MRLCNLPIYNLLITMFLGLNLLFTLSRGPINIVEYLLNAFQSTFVVISDIVIKSLSSKKEDLNITNLRP